MARFASAMFGASPVHVTPVAISLAPMLEPTDIRVLATGGGDVNSTRTQAVAADDFIVNSRNLQQNQAAEKLIIVPKVNLTGKTRFCGGRPCTCGRAIIHVGPHKTGTTSIQQRLDEWQMELAKDGYALLPEYVPGIENQWKRASNVAFSLNARVRDTHATPITWPSFLNFTKACCHQKRDIILSSESFAEANVNIAKLAVALSRWRVHIFITYRRFPDWLISLHYEVNRFHYGKGSNEFKDNRLIREVSESFVSFPEWVTGETIRDVLRTQKGEQESEITGLYTSAVWNRYRRYFAVHMLLATDDASQGIEQQLMCSDVLQARLACAAARKASKQTDVAREELFEGSTNKHKTLTYGALLVAAYRAGIVSGESKIEQLSSRLEKWHLKQPPIVHHMPLSCVSGMELERLRQQSELLERILIPTTFSSKKFNESFAQIQPKLCSVDTTKVLRSGAWRNVLKDLVGEPQPCEALHRTAPACNISGSACQTEAIAKGIRFKGSVSFLSNYNVVPVARCVGQRWADGECSSSIRERCAEEDDCAGLSQTSEGCHAMKCNALGPTANSSDRVDLKSPMQGAADPMAICPCLDTDSRDQLHAHRGYTTDIALVLLCSGSLAFLPQLVEDLSSNGVHVRQITIISKCRASKEEVLQGLSEKLRRYIHWVVSPKVGRYDHGWSEYIATNYEDLAPLTLFIKDTYLEKGLFERLSMTELLRIPLSIIGFRCAYHKSTLWHEKSAIAEFKLEQYNQPSYDELGYSVGFKAKDAHRPYYRWLEAMHVSGPPRSGFRGWRRPFWPVCYGGGFVASREALLGVPLDIWQRLKGSLSRGDNIEESHFMERSWAGLLMRVPMGTDEKKLQCASSSAVVSSGEQMRPFAGLMFCRCKDVEKCRDECPSFTSSRMCPSDRCEWDGSTCQTCNWECYLDRYPDLRDAFGKTNTAAARKHWQNVGQKEKNKGRSCICPVKTSAKACALIESF